MLESNYCTAGRYVQPDVIPRLMKRLEDILRVADNGLAAISSGKIWPRAIGALRMVCITVLSDYLREHKK